MDIGTVSTAIGATPLVELTKLAAGMPGRVFVKLESCNPGGSIKDRVALNMVEVAENDGIIVPGKTTIVEPTSGNTGIALAMIGAERGYRTVLTMPESMSVERRKLLRTYGAELVLTPAFEGMAGAVAAAESILERDADAWMPDQFSNPANPQAHEKTTGPEIFAELGCIPDHVVASVGTGGTLSGVGRYFKSSSRDIAEEGARRKTTVTAVEPAESPIISQTLSGVPADELTPGSHGIQGIGANFIPSALDLSIIDDVKHVTTAEAIAMARRMADEEGLLVGISSGANVEAALRIATLPESEGKIIVTFAADTGERYLSTPLWSHLD